MGARPREPLVRKSPALNAAGATVAAVDKRYHISRAHMSMLVDAVENETDRPDATRAMIKAVQSRYRMRDAHMKMLLEALRQFVTILQSEEHRVDHE